MPPVSQHWQTRYRVLLGMILCLSLALIASRWRETPIGAVTDDAYYIEMARSLARGLGPVLDLGPDTQAVAPQLFPSGFPLLLSPLVRLAPSSLEILKVVPLLATLFLLPLCLWLPSAAESIRLRLAVAAAVLLNPWLIAWAGRVLSDVPYTTLSLGTMLLFLVSLDPARPRAQCRLMTLGVVLLGALTVGVRTVGWTTVLAMAVVLAGQRRWWRALTMTTGIAILQLPFNAGHLVSAGYHRQMIPHAPTHPWLQATHYLSEVAVMLLPGFGAPVAAVMRRHGPDFLYPVITTMSGAALLGLTCLAIYRRRRETRTQLFAATLALTALVLANFQGYPSGVQTRLLIPVLPLLAMFTLLGVQDLFSFAGTKRLLIIMLVAALGHNGWRLAHPLRTTIAVDGTGLIDPAQGATAVAAQTPPNAVIMTAEPLTRHLHLQRPLVHFPTNLTTEAIARAAAAFGVSYIFVTPSVHYLPNRLDEKGQAMLDILQSQPAHYALMWSDQPHSLFLFRYRR